MKSSIKILGIFALAAVTFSSCTKFTQTKVYTANKPVYLSYEELRTSVANDNDRALVKPGKIFLNNDYILINDFETGIHVYDNSSPTTPKHVGFINIPGNIDIAVKDNILYADSYVDIVAIDISDPMNIKEISRVNNALSYTIPSGINYGFPVSQIDRNLGVVIKYEVGEVEESCENDECGYVYYNDVAVNRGEWGGSMMSDEGTVVNFAGNSNTVRSVANSNNQGALAGSMARFMLVDNLLYVISDESTVKVFGLNQGSLSMQASFSPWSDASGWGMIETLFKVNDYLLIGSSTGMLAYDISNPGSPEYISNYSHMNSCDPVVANENFAFVTLRSGTACGTTDLEQLDVLNIEDINNPYLIDSYELNHPHGLALDSPNDLLFVCDGEYGMNIYNVSNIERLLFLKNKSGDSYDVIAAYSRLHVIGDGGLIQYEYTEEGEVTELSRISLN